MEGAIFRSAELRAANFTKVEAQGADFKDAELVGAILAWGDFDHASFRSADLSHAQLTGGSFVGADFKDADLGGAMIMGADLSRARGLEQDQVDEACGDSRTRLPAGMIMRGCGIHMIRQTGAPHIEIRVRPVPPTPPAPPGPRYLISQQ